MICCDQRSSAQPQRLQDPTPHSSSSLQSRQQGCTHNDVLPGLVLWGHALNWLEVAAIDVAGQPCEANRSSKNGDVP